MILVLPFRACRKLPSHFQEMSSDLMQVFALLLLVHTVASSAVHDNTCYSTNDQPYLYFGSQTAYEFARNPAGIPTVPECKPLQIWMVARHGSHWQSPTETFKFTNLPDLRDQVVSNHELGRGTLCEEDLKTLRGWRQFLISNQEEDRLTPQGRHEVHALGRRVKEAFSSLLSNATDFIFRHTEMDRTKETAEYFAKGLFGDSFKPNFPEPESDDRLIEAFDNCPAWSRKNDKVQEKVEQFSKGRLMQEVYQNVSLRLGFNYNLPFYVVEAIYNACSYEQAWSLESSPGWCCAFTRRELEVLEYLEDFKFFHRTGHGDHNDMNNKLGCPLVRDMMYRFMEIEKSPNASHPAGVFYFTEAETVALVATRLGLLTDKHPLTPASFNSQSHRKYRTSALVPFTGNIIAVFYQCSTGEKYRVMFLVSEHVVDYPGCPAGLCSWISIKHKFSRVIRSASCSDDFCFHYTEHWLQVSTVELWAFIAVVATLFVVIRLVHAVNELTE